MHSIASTFRIISHPQCPESQSEDDTGFSDEEPIEVPKIERTGDSCELQFEGVAVQLPPGNWVLNKDGASGDWFISANNSSPKWVKNLISRKKAKLAAEAAANPPPPPGILDKTLIKRTPNTIDSIKSCFAFCCHCVSKMFSSLLG